MLALGDLLTQVQRKMPVIQIILNITATGNQPKAARILLVEDNPGDVYLLEKALQHRQIAYELVLYKDGQQAIEALRRDDYSVPDLILLDLNLPRREGFDVLQVIEPVGQVIAEMLPIPGGFRGAPIHNATEMRAYRGTLVQRPTTRPPPTAAGTLTDAGSRISGELPVVASSAPATSFYTRCGISRNPTSEIRNPLNALRWL